jgi:hypothetical protein
MSEKLCAVLVRLYPLGFRQRYGEEAMRLVRERARDEKGALRQLRLWFDLIRDLAATAPLYGARPPISQISLAPHGSPSFTLVGHESPSATSLFAGFLVSVTLLAAFPLALSGSGSGRKWNFPRLPLAQVTPPRADPQQASGGSGVRTVGAAMRHQVIQEIDANLKNHYFDAVMAKKMAAALQANENAGAYDTITESRVFAAFLTRQLRETSQDVHIEVLFSERSLPNGPPPPPSAEAQERYKADMLRQNCTFEQVQMLNDKVGYLKFNFFPDPAACKETAEASMAALNDAQSIILDLRDNRGGIPDMVMLIASYFFDHPEYMYNPRENTTEQSWTRSPVPGSKLADKPLYLLTSSRTISGAEHFSYNFKMLKRATLVGETTGDSAHSGVIYRVGDRFGIAIPEARPINPYSRSDWEGVGVEPDVKVNAADALATAVALARRKSSSR